MDNNQPVSLRALGRLVKKLRIHDGDVILIREGSDLAKTQTIDEFLKTCSKQGLKRVMCVVVSDFDDLKIVDESAMNKHGWFKVNALSSMIHATKEGDDAD